MNLESAIMLWNITAREGYRTTCFGGAMIALGALNYLAPVPDKYAWESCTTKAERLELYKKAAKALREWADAFEKEERDER